MGLRGTRTKQTEITSLVRVQPAGEVNNGFFGTPSLRLSGDIHNPARTFSLIFGESPRHRTWMSLSTSDSAIDIECFSDEQYDLLFHGFTNLLKQYSEQGSMSYTPAHSLYSSPGKGAASLEGGDLQHQQQTTWGRTGRAASSSPAAAAAGEAAGAAALATGRPWRCARPPPPMVESWQARRRRAAVAAKEMPEAEQFLGWRTAGTQIYARLQSAGLRVKKVWYHDRRRLILKLKLPNHKLEELAETHRYHVRQKDGTWVRFRRKNRDQMFDASSQPGAAHDLRSSERQQMIDHPQPASRTAAQASGTARSWGGRSWTASHCT